MSKKKGDEIYQKIAVKLIASDWKSVFEKLDGKSKKALFAQLDEKKKILQKRKKMEDKKSGAKSPKGKAGGDKGDSGRKTSYRFGSRNVQVMKPSKGYDKKTDV